MWIECLSTVQFAIGCVFAFAALAKLRDFRSFVSGVADYELLPRRFVSAFATLVVLSEVMVGLSHVTSLFLGQAVVIGIVMTGLFLVAASIGLKKKRPIRCMCFGPRGDEEVSMKTVMQLTTIVAAETLILFELNAGTAFQATQPLQMVAVAVTALALLYMTRWVFALPTLFYPQRFRSSRVYANALAT